MTIKELDVLGLPNELDTGEFKGFNELRPKLLKELANFVTDPWTLSFNLPVTQGRLSRDWRNAIVSPVFKIGTKHEPENYQSGSLISGVVKISEKIIRKDLFKYLNESRIPLEEHHGCRIGYSCLISLLVARESLYALAYL